MPDLRQMAARWLASVGVLPHDSPALQEGPGGALEFALILQDGSVLCNCVNKLIPGCIKPVHQKPEKQFLKMQNINAFITALTTNFGLKPSEVFSAEQLFYASDFALVVQTLSLLSKTPAAGLAGFKYFPETARVHADEGRDEDTYQNLEDLVGQSISLQDSAANQTFFMEDEAEVETESEKIYGSIQSVIEDSGQDVYTDLLYAGKAGPSDPIYGTGGLTSPDEKRNCVLAELHDTERNYVGVLHVIADSFQASFQREKTISKSDIRIIFLNVGEILKAHTDFLNDIEKQLKSQTGRIVSDAFQRAMGPFRCYGLFCCEIPEAINKLKELQAKPLYAKILDQAKKDSGQRFALKDLLNVPMQRILKYPLLLKELIKHTPESHPDKQNLRAALIAVQSLATFINDTKKDYDALRNMIQSLKQYNGRPLHEYGSLQKDGDLMYRLDAPREKLKSRYIFLFSTALLICKPKGVFYHFKTLIELDAETELTEIAFWKLSKEEQASAKPYEFFFSIKSKKSSSEAHVLAAKSAPVRKKWMREIQQNIDALKDKKAAPPTVTPRGATMKVSTSSTSALAESTRPKTTPGPPPSIPAPSPPGPPAAKAAAGKPSYEVWSLQSTTPSSTTSASSSASASDVGLDINKAGDESWFAGKVARGKAEKILEGLPDGTYLLRESDSRAGDYSLSVKYGVVKHIKINRDRNMYDLAPDAKQFPNIQELIEHYSVHSLNRHFPGMDTTLEKPFRTVMSQKTTGGMVQGKGRARSRYPYTAHNEDELSFDRGVELVIISENDSDPGWWKGCLVSGGPIGIFPANYVTKLA